MNGGQGCFWTWRHTILLQRIMLVSTIRTMLITTRFSRQSIGSTAIPQYRPSSARSLWKTVYLFRTNGMRSRKSRIRSIFHTILLIRTARLAISRSLNSDMPRKIKGFRSSTIPSRMTATTGNRCSTRPTLAASLIYPSCS